MVNEYAPRRWREEVVALFNKEDKADPGESRDNATEHGRQNVF